MCVKLLPRNLNLGLYPPHSTSIYTCGASNHHTKDVRGANERINPFLFCFNISDGNETSWDYLYVSLWNYVYNIFANNICVLHLQFCIFAFWKHIYIYILEIGG